MSSTTSTKKHGKSGKRGKPGKPGKRGKLMQTGGLSVELVPLGLTLATILSPGKGFFNRRNRRNSLRWPGTTPWETTRHKNWSRRGARGIHTRRINRR